MKPESIDQVMPYSCLERSLAFPVWTEKALILTSAVSISICRGRRPLGLFRMVEGRVGDVVLFRWHTSCVIGFE